jgi:hypothetical protein
MTYTFKLSRRIARLRAPVFAALVVALGACDHGDSLAPSEGDANPQPMTPAPTFAASYAGGIPIGITAQPNEAFGTRFNGGLRNIFPEFLNRDLGEIKARGGKVALMMAGPDFLYKDADGHFSLTKWKARIDRYDGVNFDAYIKDGTLIGHYLIDEPNDPANWNGQTIPGTVLDEMARYSKAKWPNLVTIVRTQPDYLEKWGPYRYLDAAWAQYVERKGTAAGYLADNVASAKRQGLGLVVGLNVLKGGVNNGEMSASQVRTWGEAMLNSTYPCAFVSWKWDDNYLASSAMKDAMDYLRQLAEKRAFKTCAATAGGSTPPPSDPPPSDPPPPPPSPSAAHALPFGLFQAPVAEYTSRWTGGLYRADPSRIVGQLNQAANAGMRIVVSLTTSARSKNADGTFSLTKWKAQVDAYRGLGLGSFVSNRTMYAHYLVDQPNCAACWGGRAISWETVEEMARYSKSIWPGLATTVRAAPTVLAGASFRWTYLDAGWAQYNTRRGDARSFVANEAAAAQAEGLGLIVGANFLESAGANSASMTSSQIKAVGTALAKSASVCALVGWKYSASYLGQPGIRQAFDSVATVAKSRSVTSCVVN